MGCLAVAMLTYTGSMLAAFIAGLWAQRVIAARPAMLGVERQWLEDVFETETYEPYDANLAPAADFE